MRNLFPSLALLAALFLLSGTCVDTTPCPPCPCPCPPSDTTAVRDKSTPDFRVVEFDTPAGVVVYHWLPTASGNSLQATIGGRVVTVTETPQKI